MKQTSPWFDSVSDEVRYPILHQKIKADVVVVGGGIVGVLAAWHLTKAGKRVVLLEKNHIASSDTGFTTAFLTRVPDTSLADLAERYGKDFIAKVFAATATAQQEIYSLIEEQQINCDFHKCSSFNYSSTPNNAQLQADWQALAAIPNVWWRTSDQLSGTGIPMAEAIEYEQEARYDVRKFLFGLLQTKIGKTITIYEESEATAVQVEKDRVVVETSTGAVVSDRVVLATGIPMQAVAELRSLITHNITFALAAQFEKPIPLADNLYWDAAQPYHYFRLLDDRTVILGGADQSGDQPIPEGEQSPHTVLETFLKTTLQQSHSVSHTWSGSLFQTVDGLPYIAEHPHYSKRIFFATGLEGNGMVMGALAGKLLADVVRDQAPSVAPLFGLERTGVTVPKPSVKPAQMTAKSGSNHKWLGWLIPLFYLGTIWMPAYYFFFNRGGVGFLEGLDFATISIFLFPLLGLYAFYFVWAQLLLGSCMNVLRKISPWFERWHRTQGVFALLFALSHPIFIIIGYGFGPYLEKAFVGEQFFIYVWLGQIQLFILLLTVAAALLMRLRWIQRWWWYVHLLNYAVFIMAWIHGWFLGSDVQIPPLKYLWWWFGITMIGSVLWRIYRAVRKTSAVESGPATGEYVTVGKVADIPNDKPFFAEVNGKQLVIFNLKGKFYALDNLCSHAEGPLHQGRYEAGTIECPWHRSKFDITTGSVMAGPARRAQTMHAVRVVNDELQIQL